MVGLNWMNHRRHAIMITEIGRVVVGEGVEV